MDNLLDLNKIELSGSIKELRNSLSVYGRLALDSFYHFLDKNGGFEVEEWPRVKNVLEEKISQITTLAERIALLEKKKFHG